MAEFFHVQSTPGPRGIIKSIENPRDFKLISDRCDKTGLTVTTSRLRLAGAKLTQRYKGKAYVCLWDADFRDTLRGTVTANGSHRYSVFVTATGKRAVVVINQKFSKAITAKVTLPDSGRLVVTKPEQPEARRTSGTVQIPARSAVVLMEQ